MKNGKGFEKKREGKSGGKPVGVAEVKAKKCWGEKNGHSTQAHQLGPRQVLRRSLKEKKKKGC